VNICAPISLAENPAAVIEAAVVEVLGQVRSVAKSRFEAGEDQPRLPLNKINATTLAAAWGPMTDNWIGRPLDLRPEKVLFNGGMVPAIRVAAVLESAKAAPAPVPEAAAPVTATDPLSDAAEPDEGRSK
jgi:hypothetical protein